MKLDAAKSHDIRELMIALRQNGTDNYTYAVCEIAVDGELSVDAMEALTDEEYGRIVALYQDVGGPFGWNRERAIRVALDAAMTQES